MNSKKIVSYSLLAHIQTSGVLLKDLFDVFIPLVKKSLSVLNEKGLNKIIDKDEKVLLMLNESSKFWFYEGRIKAIQDIINESAYIDELYIITKKYEWLVCINHHDYLIGTGELMLNSLKY